tara:strand:- start:1056 stop:1223 length:168 start_codon:yes stop_codon:yes gene_type:complete
VDNFWYIINKKIKKSKRKENINKVVSDLARLYPINKYNNIEQLIRVAKNAETLKI